MPLPTKCIEGAKCLVNDLPKSDDSPNMIYKLMNPMTEEVTFGQTVFLKCFEAGQIILGPRLITCRENAFKNMVKTLCKGGLNKSVFQRVSINSLKYQ